MKLLIGTGIFEPDAGGPATYTPKLATRLVEHGWDVHVLTYSDSIPKGFDSKYTFAVTRIQRVHWLWNRIRYFFHALMLVPKVDLVYTLDWFASGFPLAVVAWLFRKPYVVRVGGDYAWEEYIEAGKVPLPLLAFYERGMHRRGLMYVVYRCIQFVLRKARTVIFNTSIQRDLYVRSYGLSRENTTVIWNPVPQKELQHVERGAATKELVFWGRFARMKNIDSLVRAFAKARLPSEYTLVLVGKGPHANEIHELVDALGIRSRVSFVAETDFNLIVERIKNARAFILPSWTDISPNQVYEALAIGLPTLVTKENFLEIRDELPEMVDPCSVDDIAAKLEMLADDERYLKFASVFRAIRLDHGWEDVREQHESVFREALSV